MNQLEFGSGLKEEKNIDNEKEYAKLIMEAMNRKVQNQGLNEGGVDIESEPDVDDDDEEGGKEIEEEGWLGKKRPTNSAMPTTSSASSLDMDHLIDQHRKLAQHARRSDASCGDFKKLLQLRARLIIMHRLSVEDFLKGIPQKISDKVQQFYKGLKWTMSNEEDDQGNECAEEEAI